MGLAGDAVVGRRADAGLEALIYSPLLGARCEAGTHDWPVSGSEPRRVNCGLYLSCLLLYLTNMAATEPTFEDLLHIFETALLAYERLGESPVHPPEYATEEGVITLASIERYKVAQARYKEFTAAQAQAEQSLSLAKAALDAWFPTPVIAAFDQGVAMVAPADKGVIVLVRHHDSYLIERGATQEEALNKIERFLNQF